MRFFQQGRNITTLIVVLFVSLVASPHVYAMTAQPYDGDNSQWITQSAYPTVEPGQQFHLEFTFENTGTTEWSNDTGYALGCDTYYHHDSNCMGGSPAVLNEPNAIDDFVEPGDTGTYSVQLTAPEQPGTYTTYWDMQHNGTIFGNNNVYIRVTVAQGTDNAQWVSQSQYPTVYPGQYFSISFTFQNTGTTTWTDDGGYELVCDTYYHPDNNCMQANAARLDQQVILPQQDASFTVDFMIAPHKPGVYVTYWDMALDGSIFGNNNVYIQVTVVPYPTQDSQYEGHVLAITQQTRVLDVNGDPIPARCNGPSDNPNGGGNASLPPGWNVVGMSIMPGFDTAQYTRQEGNNLDTYILVAYPDPCNQQGKTLDFSSNSDIANGTGAVGFVSEEAVNDTTAVAPVKDVSNPVLRQCWEPNTCSNSVISTIPSSLPSNDGKVLYAWWNGSMWDPHWWHVSDDGSSAAVYGRDWTAS